jgi:hypothetical protein
MCVSYTIHMCFIWVSYTIHQCDTIYQPTTNPLPMWHHIYQPTTNVTPHTPCVFHTPIMCVSYSIHRCMMCVSYTIHHSDTRQATHPLMPGYPPFNHTHQCDTMCVSYTIECVFHTPLMCVSYILHTPMRHHMGFIHHWCMFHTPLICISCILHTPCMFHERFIHTCDTICVSYAVDVCFIEHWYSFHTPLMCVSYTTDMSPWPSCWSSTLLYPPALGHPKRCGWCTNDLPMWHHVCFIHQCDTN